MDHFRDVINEGKAKGAVRCLKMINEAATGGSTQALLWLANNVFNLSSARQALVEERQGHDDEKGNVMVFKLPDNNRGPKTIDVEVEKEDS